MPNSASPTLRVMMKSSQITSTEGYSSWEIAATSTSSPPSTAPRASVTTSTCTGVATSTVLRALFDTQEEVVVTPFAANLAEYVVQTDNHEHPVLVIDIPSETIVVGDRDPWPL